MKNTLQTLGGVALAIACCAGARCACAEEGLVAHFTFDDASKFGYDRVQGAEIGEIVNTSIYGVATADPTSCEAPWVRGLRTATGWWQNNYMTVPGASFGSAQGIPCGKQAVTYSLWIKPSTQWQWNNTDGMGAACMLLRHGDIGKEWYNWKTHHNLWIVKDGSGFPKVVFSGGEGYSDKDSAVYSLGKEFDGAWHFIAATYADAVLKLYYDGVPVAEKTLDADSNVPDNSSLVFGAPANADYDAYCRDRYAGGVDDIRVYNRALSADEVAAAHRAGATAYDTDVLAWTGAAAGGAVTEAANWETKSNRRTVEEIYADGAVLDATALDDGGALTHDAAATLPLKGVICSNGQDAVTLEMKAGALALDRPSTQRGLVAHLSFDDPNDLLADSGTAGLTATTGYWSEYPAELAKTVPITAVDGVCGKAMDFPGNGKWWYWTSPYVKTDAATTTAANGIPCGASAVTYSLWIKPMAEGRWNNGLYGLANSNIFIFRRGNYGQGFSTYLWLVKGPNDGRLDWSIANWADAEDTCTYDPDNLFDGAWHHVVCIYENKTLTLYYDGAKVATKATEHTLAMSDGQPISFGNSEDTSGYNGNLRRYLGGFDEFKVFNVALTDEEVAAEYAQRSRTLDTTSAGTVPSSVTLRLDAGTTATVRGYGHEYGILIGEGTVSVGGASALALDGAYALTGALTGCGDVTAAGLVLGGDASGFTGTFTLGENATVAAFDADGAPLAMTFGGTVTLPASAVVTWGKPPAAGKATLTAATLVPPADFSGWRDADGQRVRVRVDGNTLKISAPRGLVVTIR